jgi:DNA invertase Pin-like site-specific DNA recombinase
VRLAAEHGAAELWVQHSGRLARGDGLAADHLAEVFFEMRRAGVTLRSVEDNSTFTNPMLVAAIGERNREDSARKSAATRAGKRRRWQSGKAVGGPSMTATC